MKRPDFEAVMVEEEPSSFWFLSVSSKLYSSTYDDITENDLRSTMPDKLYRKKDGSENKKCCHLRESWETLLKEKEGCFNRNLRIHFCSPEVNRLEYSPEHLFTHGDSIVAYITAKNVHKMLRSDTVSTLREIGCLP